MCLQGNQEALAEADEKVEKHKLEALKMSEQLAQVRLLLLERLLSCIIRCWMSKEELCTS